MFVYINSICYFCCRNIQLGYDSVKRFFFLALLFSTSFLTQAADTDGQVYHWVDKDGLVHYADKPNSKTAVLIDVQETASNSVIKSDIQLPDLTSQKETPQLNTQSLSSEDQQYCQYILDQINLAKEAIKTGSELKADYAKAYIKSSDRLLRENNCI